MQDGRKAVWRISYISVEFFPISKYNFIAYRSSKVSSHPDCIFEIHQLWQSGFISAYSNSRCSCSFEPEINKISQSSQKMYNNNILDFQESTTILPIENSYNSSVPFQDIALKTYRKWWTKEKGGGKGSGMSLLNAWHDGDDDICGSHVILYT